VSADVSEEHITSIFRAEEISSARNLLACWFLAELISLTLKMEAMFLQNVSRHSTDYTALYPRS
jgi:hypothetical protein